MRSVESAARSRAFYRALGATGLAIRTKPEWDAQILETLVALLPSGSDVLDVGCGYGRIAVPLAARGYSVTGLDVAPNLLRAARQSARWRGVPVRFVQASMTSMPLPDQTFDAVVSLWTAFYELLLESEQVAALSEMRRVLRPGGVGIVEGPVPADGIVPDGGRVQSTLIAGHRNAIFAHDVVTLERACDGAGIRDRTVTEHQWAGRVRQVLVFHR
jgi:SAM-dependent methyltransferase